MLLAHLIFIFMFGIGFGMYFVSLITGRGNKWITIGWMAFYLVGGIYFAYCVLDLVNS